MDTDATVERALLLLAARTAGGRSHFEGFDVDLGHTLAARVAQGVGLTEAQRNAGWRMLRKYAAPLAALGLDFGQIPSPNGGPAPEPMDLPPTGVKIACQGDKIVVRGTKFTDADLLRTIPNGRWVKSHLAWTFPASPTSARSVAVGLRSLRPEVSEGFAALVAEAESLVEHAKIKEREDLEPIPNEVTPSWMHQRQAFAFASRLRGAVLNMEMGEQPHRTPVLTPAGWTRFGDLEVGDWVVGSDGLPHKVLRIKEFARRELVWMVLNDGAVVECATTHPWTVRRTRGRPVTVTAAQIEASLLLPNYQRLWLLPDLAPVQFPTAAVPLDPYVLGVLLADGSFTRCCAPDGGKPARFTTSKPGVAAEVDERTPGWRLADYGDGSHYALWPAADVRAVVHVLGLCGVGSRDKFIPEPYLLGSVSQRQDLLRGLMLDGGGAKVSPEFCTTSKQLAEDVSALARSLGGTGRVRPYQRPDCVDYRVTLGVPMGTGHRTHARRIVAVQRTGIFEPMRCIEVDTPDSLYVTDGYVLTHNTGKTKPTIDLLRESGEKRILITCPERVIDVWPKQFRLHGPDDLFHIVNGKTTSRTGKRSLMPIKDRTREFDEALNGCRCGRAHVLITNYAASAHEPFASWSLEQNWDYMVFDEGHKLRSYTGVWSRWASKIGKRSAHRLDLTGTLMPQTPMDVFGQFRAIDPDVFGTSFIAFERRYAIKGGYEGREFRGMNPATLDEFSQRLHSITYTCGEEVLDLPEMLPDTTFACTLSPAARKAYKAIDEEFYALIRTAEVEDVVNAPNVLVKMLRLQQITGGAVNTDSGAHLEIDTSKADLLKEVLEDISPDTPVVVFGRFIHDLDAIQRVAKKMKRRYGELSGRRDDAVTSDATLAPGVQVAGVQIQSGGTGIDLTASHFGIYYSLGYSLSDYLQSRKRLHRPGQANPTRFIHLVAADTIDEDVYEALADRKSVVDHAIAKRRGTS